MPDQQFRISPLGVVVGALVCAVCRGGVVLLNVALHVSEELQPTAIWFALLSAGIGLVVGALAGMFSGPWRGALVGALFSGFLFELFMLPCAFACEMIGGLTGEKGAGVKFLAGVWPYLLEMAAAGAVAGAISGIVGKMDLKNSVQSLQEDEIHIID